MGPHGPMSPMDPMGPMGSHGSPWGPVGQMASHSRIYNAGGGRKFYTGGAWEPKKLIFIKKSRDPGLNHEPRVVFYAEFESGIENDWNVDENIKNYNFLKK